MLDITYFESLRTPKQRKAVEAYTTHAFPTVNDILQSNRYNPRRLVTHGSKAGTLQPKDDVTLIISRDDVELSNPIIRPWNGDGRLQSHWKIVGTISNHDIGNIDTHDPDKHLMYRLDSYLYKPTDIIQCHQTNRYIPKNDACILHGDYYDRDHYYDRNICYWCDYYDEYILNDDVVTCEVTGYGVHKEDHDVQHVSQGWVLTGDEYVVWCEDEDQYAHIDNCRYCDERDGYYSEDDYYEYRSHSRINDYHCGVTPEKYLANPNDQLGQYTIGFEVEKTGINGDTSGNIEQQPLFSHWERDSSCGVEGITHVYSLNNDDVFYEHLNTSDYIDQDVDRRCGGHINVAHIKNQLEMWHFKPWMGLIWSIWRYRLKNQYSNRNKKVNPYMGRDHHYGALVEKGRSDAKRFEIRLPSRVHDKWCLRRRYQLMQHLMTCIDDYMHERFDRIAKTTFVDKHMGIPNSVADNAKVAIHAAQEELSLLNDVPRATFRRVRYLIDASLPVLQKMYYDSPNRLAEVILLAYMFQWYIDSPNDTPLPTAAYELIKEFIND